MTMQQLSTTTTHTSTFTTIFSRRTQNGRWGLEIVGPAGTEFPARGHLSPLGELAGVTCFKFTPDTQGAWVLTLGDAEVISGGTVAAAFNLQGGNHATIVIAHEGAVIRTYGYDRRGSRLHTLREGQLVELSPAVALAAGVQPDKPGCTIEAPPAPAVLPSGDTPIWEWSSANGRMGIQIIGPAGTEFPAQGRLESLGHLAGVDCFRFIPDTQASTWVWPVDELAAIHGGAVAANESHGFTHPHILLTAHQAVVEVGNRRKTILAIDRGRVFELSPAQWLAVQQAGQEVEAPEQTAFGAAFARLGL